MADLTDEFFSVLRSLMKKDDLRTFAMVVRDSQKYIRESIRNRSGKTYTQCVRRAANESLFTNEELIKILVILNGKCWAATGNFAEEVLNEVCSEKEKR